MEKKKIIIISIITVIVLGLLIGMVFIINQNKTKGEIDNENTKSNEVIEENTIDLELTGEEYSPSKVYKEDNTEIALSDFSDKPMALLFFNTTEIEASKSVRILQKYYDNYKEKINFVNISVIDGVTETKEDIKEFLERNNITIPVLYDTEYLAKNEYKIESIPTFVFINKNNEIINTISTDINEDVIEANLDIIAENY